MITAPLILCCEDEAELRRDIVEELSEAGYRTVEAADGEEALTQLAACRPDLILCDITMPRLDGYGVLRRVRRDHRELDRMPFVFLTVFADPADMVEGKRAGADDYLVKPIDFDLLLATVEARLREVERWRTHEAHALDEPGAALDAMRGGGALAVLDAIATGVVLLGPGGAVLHANPAASQLIGRLGAAADPKRLPTGFGGAALRDLLDRGERASRDGAAFSGAAALDAAGGQIMAMAVALSGEGGDGQSRLALFLVDTANRTRLSDAMLAQLFGLTPTESAVAGRLAAGERLDAIAAALGISQTTVSFHLRNIFGKTRTNRQADLIALMLCAPVLGGCGSPAADLAGSV
ncbi:MAG: response regulator [Salinarimonas sp.]|nr:response regulator [Salinarimonas sp.]